MAGTSARETAYWMIRNRIMNLDLRPHDVLNDKELEEQMRMSRTPIREAIIMLSLNQLVVVRPQSGTYVAPIDLEKVEIEQFSRYVLEKEMATLACRTIREETWREYEEKMQLYEFYENSQIADRENRMFEIDNAFHRIAFSINSRAKCYDWMVASLQHIERIRILSLRMELNQQISQEHRGIANAIWKGDAELTDRLLRQHLTKDQEHILIMKKKYPHFFS